MRRLALLLVVGVVLAGCSRAAVELEPTPSPTPVETDSPTPTPEPTPTEAFPLTGVPTFEPALDRPVIAAKIDHAPGARPQIGLEIADIVYEELVEGGSTRFLALFHSNIPPEVGPLRSGRLVDVHILSPWNGVFVYSGARPEVRTVLANAGIARLVDSGPPLFFRLSGRRAPHNLMARTDEVLARAATMSGVEPVPDVPYVFTVDPPAGGVEQHEFEIRMSSSYRTGWAWEEPAEVFRRFQNGVPSEVVGDGQIGAANVVAILTDIGLGGCCDTSGARYVTTRLQGDGAAVVWRDGQRYQARWVKDGPRDHLRILDMDGNDFAFARGSTWFHLGPLDSAPPPPDAQ